jgi:hypothetical protein
MDKGTIAAIVGVLVVAAVVAIRRPRKPAQTHFTCQRCHAVAAHDERTARAWRAGKERFFCSACHGKWLASRPHQSIPPRGKGPATRGTGCLAILLVTASVPPMGWALHHYLF